MGNCQKLRYRMIRKTKLGASNYEIVDILEKISKKKNFPPEIQSVLNDSCMNIMDAKLKREISEYFPRLKRIHKQKKYWKNARNITTELFLKLPHKYIKGFLVFSSPETTIPENNLKNLNLFKATGKVSELQLVSPSSLNSSF